MKGKCKHSKNGYCSLAVDLRCVGYDETEVYDCEEYEEEEDDD